MCTHKNICLYEVLICTGKHLDSDFSGIPIRLEKDKPRLKTFEILTVIDLLFFLVSLLLCLK